MLWLGSSLATAFIHLHTAINQKKNINIYIYKFNWMEIICDFNNDWIILKFLKPLFWAFLWSFYNKHVSVKNIQLQKLGGVLSYLNLLLKMLQVAFRCFQNAFIGFGCIILLINLHSKACAAHGQKFTKKRTTGPFGFPQAVVVVVCRLCARFLGMCT